MGKMPRYRSKIYLVITSSLFFLSAGFILANSGIPTSTILLIGLIAGVIFLVLLLVLVSLVFGRRQAQRKQDKDEITRFKKDEEQVLRDAEREASRFRENLQVRGTQSTDKPINMQTPPMQKIAQEDNVQTQPLSDKLGDQAIQERLQKLWEQVDTLID